MGRHNTFLRTIRVLFMLVVPLALMGGLLAVAQSVGAGPNFQVQCRKSNVQCPKTSGADFGLWTFDLRLAVRAPGAPYITPPTDLHIVTLDSSLHITWAPSSDPTAAWHVVSIWQGNGYTVQEQSKVVGRTGRAIQTNGLMPNHTYMVKVQAMDAQGNLSDPLVGEATTDPQSPMPNAAFFENFNGPAGDLDYNYFDVRTSHGVGLQPESIGVDKMLTFNNENHFHTQMIGGVQRGELYIRPRVPFDFANRTGTFQFEVDTAAVQHSEGKWFEIHLVRDIPWSAEEFGAGNGEGHPNSIEFSVRQGDGPGEMNVNIPQITVNIGGNVLTYEGTVRQLTPVNIRMPVVLRVGQNSAEMFINGVSVVRATGFTLPFTRGYWILAHRAWYASRDTHVSPVIIQLIHWETIQYDGPQGSFNPIVRTYLQPGCPGVVHNEHEGIVGCPSLQFDSSRRTNSFNINVNDDPSTGTSAKVLYNGYASGTGNLVFNVNGHTMTIPTRTSGFLYTLNTYDFPANWLQQGNNAVQITYAGNGDAMIGAVEFEVVYGRPRVMQYSGSMDPMPMMSVSNMNFRFDHRAGDPMVVTATTYLYNLGAATPLNYNATVISTETPWLTASPTLGLLRSPALGYGLVPLTLSVDFTNIPVDADGDVGVIKITGGNMPVYLGVLAVNLGNGSRPNFITTFTGPNTTFNKDAIPGYHGEGTPLPTHTQAPNTNTPVPTNTRPAVTNTPAPTNTRPAITNTPVPTNTQPAITGTPVPTNTRPAATNTPIRTATAVPTGTQPPRTDTPVAPTATQPPVGTGTPVPTDTPANTPSPMPTVCGFSFSDVPPDYWAHQYINYMACHRIISGYADGTFRPYNNTTRGQLCKIVVLAEGWPIDTSGGPHFSDVSPDNAFYPYVETAFHRHIISGYADGTFKPGNNVTRAQLCKIVVLAAGWTIDTRGGPHFSDVPTGSPFYGFIETAFNHHIISGYLDGAFRPGNPATRAQVCKVVYNRIFQP